MDDFWRAVQSMQRTAQAEVEIPGLDPLYVANEGKLLALFRLMIAAGCFGPCKTTRLAASPRSSARSCRNILASSR
jgi:hypothetical protein